MMGVVEGDTLYLCQFLRDQRKEDVYEDSGCWCTNGTTTMAETDFCLEHASLGWRTESWQKVPNSVSK
jgi:hypothetical protein